MTRGKVVAQVLSGGQTGVDRAALEAARDTGTPYAGWVPRGGRAEDHDSPPGVRAEWPGLRETPGVSPDDRTARNVAEADAVLVLRLDPEAPSPGTELTVQVAEQLVRPTYVAAADGSAEPVVGWLTRVSARLGRPVVLDVAGPRESEDPGVHDAAVRTLRAVLAPPGQ